jgi:hypothetical protein
MGLVGQFQQIQDEAKMRPIRAALAQIQLANQQQALQDAPLSRQLRLAQISEAQQNAAVPHQIIDSVTLSGGTPNLVVADPNADFADYQISKDGYTPRIRTTSGSSIGAGGIASPFERTETLATGEQVAREIATSEALNASRLNQGSKTYEFDQLKQKMDAAAADGDAEGAAFYKARMDKLTSAPVAWVTTKSSVDADGNLILNQINKATGELREVPTGRKPSLSERQLMMMQFTGGAPVAVVAPPAVAPAAVARADVAAGVSADAQALIDRAAGTLTAAAIPTLTVEQARIAPINTDFIGTDGKKRHKNADGTVTLIIQ